MAIFSSHTEISLQLSGGRLVGERSHGVSVQMLEGSRAMPLSSGSTDDVRVYWVERADSR
jgi:hypothetical protein